MDKQTLTADAWEAGSENYFPDDPRREAFEGGFKRGAEWLLLRPLSERLTEEEKLKLKNIMKYPQRYTELIEGTIQFQMIGIQKVLIEIFGADLFKGK